MKKYNFIGITILFLLGAGYFGYSILEDMQLYKGYKIDYADTLDLSNTLMDVKEYFWESDDTNREANFRLNKALQANDRALNSFMLLMVLVLLYFGTIYMFFRNKVFTLAQLAISTITISLVFLVLGVFTPMMEISVYLDGFNLQLGKGMDDIPFLSSILPEELTLDGKMFAFYQCKSISDLIGILFGSGNFFVGTAILFFSVIFPVLKLIFSFLFVLSKNMRNKKLFVNIVSYIGKYSMADVYVVGIFLAYLAFSNISNAVTTEGKMILGLYLFTGYCILSILVFFVIKKLTGKYFEEKKIGYEESLILDPHQPLIEE